MSEHITHCVDEMVSGHRGTVAYCTCGWKDAWSIQGGNAEASAHGHSMRYNPEYRQEHIERVAKFNTELSSTGCTCGKFTEDFGYVLDINCPIHWVRSVPSPVYELCHSCSCHLDPPCGACENCGHMAGEIDCPNDCQDCYDHDYS